MGKEIKGPDAKNDVSSQRGTNVPLAPDQTQNGSRMSLSICLLLRITLLSNWNVPVEGKGDSNAATSDLLRDIGFSAGHDDCRRANHDLAVRQSAYGRHAERDHPDSAECKC